MAAASAAFVSVPSAQALTAAPSLSLSTVTINVHTANGQTWKFSITAGDSPQSSSGSLSLSISRTVTRPAPGGETHYWSLSIPSGSLKFNKNTGHGTLITPHSVSSLTTVNMSFSRTATRHATCKSGSETIYRGNLSGRATLITGLHGGGTIGGQHLAFPTGSTSLTADNNCQTTFPVSHVCSTAQYFSASKSPLSMNGYHSGSASSIYVSHGITLKQPAGAYRSDSVYVRSSHAPVFSKTAKTLQVFGSPNSLVTGAGKLKASTLSHQSNPCKVNRVSHTQEQYSANTATFTNAAGKPLVGHSSLSGKLAMPGNSSGYFFVDFWH